MTYALYLIDTNERDITLDFIVNLRISIQIRSGHSLYSVLECFQNFTIGHAYILEEHLVQPKPHIDIKIERLDIRIGGLNSEKQKIFPNNMETLATTLKYMKVN